MQMPFVDNRPESDYIGYTLLTWTSHYSQQTWQEATTEPNHSVCDAQTPEDIVP
jgi:hypothetical protein